MHEIHVKRKIPFILIITIKNALNILQSDIYKMKKHAFDMVIFSLNKYSYFLWEIMGKVICIIIQLNISALYDAERLGVLAWHT